MNRVSSGLHVTQGLGRRIGVRVSQQRFPDWLNRFNSYILIVMAIITMITAVAQLFGLFFPLNLLINFLLQLDQSGHMDKAVLRAHDPRHFQETEDDVPLIIMQHQVFGFKDDSLPDIQEAAPFDEITDVVPGVK